MIEPCAAKPSVTNSHLYQKLDRRAVEMKRATTFLACLLAASLSLQLVDAFTPSFIGRKTLLQQPQQPQYPFQHRPIHQSHEQMLSTTTLYAKKKSATAAPTKLQVKLLKPVPGTGQKGDVVHVTPAFYQNKLQPTRAATLISDEQVATEQSIKVAQVNEMNEKAQALANTLGADDFELIIQRKAGPDGQLFGGIGPKVVLTELQAVLKDDFLKSVKVKSLVDDEKKPLQGDIKHVGSFSATLELTKEITATFPVIVKAE
ncbi:hypothetical protein MPSEU_000220500 [Mayamaea pseudoterrestris]|nr:hypothetical protein MPSEU_000220500 [Mayamaea pseudoterrestris]